MQQSRSVAGDGPLNVLGIAGSLRARSFNRALLAAARELAPERLVITPFELREVPLYDGDEDRDGARPAGAQRLKDAVAACDGLLIVTPEYNHGIPGVLKNAIDWASRPGMRSPLAGKPVAMMGAAPGLIGTARAQLHLENVLMSTQSHVMPHPGVLVGAAAQKFGDDLRLTDQATRDFVGAFLRQFAEWIERMKR